MISTPPPNLKVSKEALTKFSHMDDPSNTSLSQGGVLGGGLWEPESKRDAHSKDGEGVGSLDHQGPATGQLAVMSFR